MVQDMEYTGIYYQWQEEKEDALALDLTVVAQCITLRERGYDGTHVATEEPDM